MFKAKNLRFTHVPSERELVTLPMVRPGEFELNEREVRTVRSRCYSINKDSVTYRFRTVRDGPLLLVWRLRK